MTFARLSTRRPTAVRFQVPLIRLAASDRKTGMGLRHVPLAFAGCSLFRRKARARTVPSPEGRLARALVLAGPAVPPVSGFGRFRHLRVSGNAHKPLTF